eukprot:TRINITY_DN2916_c1_g1_i3.p1 TRINITY_DN2916_c1_g1~~TRINITY_DN2916_c1_g1_i3.p1  ORF type:complete len:146 (+),score=42.40 TRINITY_DN2916_c1_g1_i3:457-894(+)
MTDRRRTGLIATDCHVEIQKSTRKELNVCLEPPKISKPYKVMFQGEDWLQKEVRVGSVIKSYIWSVFPHNDEVVIFPSRAFKVESHSSPTSNNINNETNNNNSSSNKMPSLNNNNHNESKYDSFAPPSAALVDDDELIFSDGDFQ